MSPAPSDLDLTPAERQAFQQLVELIGLERTAQISAALTARAGGPPNKPDTAAMLQMARIKLLDRARGNHSIAFEVAKSDQFRSNLITIENLTKRYNRMFSDQQFKWTLLAKRIPEDRRISPNAREKDSVEESRALVRLIDILESEMNFYDALLADAKRLGPVEAEAVSTLGRKLCDSVIMKRIEEQQGDDRPRGFKPRSFYDLVFHHPDGPPKKGA